MVWKMTVFPVIWEIILRDFWALFMRPLIMPYRRWNANARGLSI
jgi:hypothetical protein